MIPFERQFQTFHSLQNYFLLNELLAPGFPMPLVDTDALREARGDFVAAVRRAALLLRPGGHAAGAPRRGGSGPLGPAHADLRLRATDPPRRRRRPARRRTGPDARLLAGGTDLIIRLRDGTIRPRIVVDLKRIAELDGEIREADGRLRDRRADRDDRHREPTRGSAATTWPWPRRRRSSGPSRSGTGRRSPGNICNASPAADTAPALLVYGAERRRDGSGRDATHPDRRVLRPLRASRPSPAGELVTAIELPRPTGRLAARPRPADAPPRPRPRLGDAGLRGLAPTA